jgi:hypothetical protein
MDAPRTGTDGSVSLLGRLRRWVATVDRGWKATLLGLVIVLVYAVGPL